MALKPLGGRIRASLGTAHVAGIREHGLLRRRFDCASAECAPGDAGASSWGAAVRELGRLLDTPGWRGLPLDVVVSSEFVRFALVGEVKAQLSSLELEGLAHGMFSRVLGESVSDWSVRYCAIDGATVLAAAMEKAMLAALEDVAREHDARLRSVAPLWSCAANRCRRRLRRRSAWLVLAEARAAAYGLVENGRWRAVRAKALDPGQGLDAPLLIERESRLLGSETREVIAVGDVEAGRFPAGWTVVQATALSPSRFGALPDACRLAALAGS